MLPGAVSSGTFIAADLYPCAESMLDAPGEPTLLARDMSIRVLILSDAAPGRNGVGSYYADLAEQLKSRVGEVALFHPSNVKSPGYRYLTAPLPGDKTQRIAIPRPACLWRAVKAINPTVIIVPTPGPFGLAGLILARKLQVPLIIGFHTHYEALAALYWQNRFGAVCQFYLSWCNRLLFRHGQLVLANSPEMLNQAIGAGAQTASLMGTSVPEQYITATPTAWAGTVRRILFAGRLAEEKNLPDVIDAARRHQDLEFTIAGDGPLRKQVEKAASYLPNLRYTGWVARADLMDLVDAHDVLLLPSSVESFGTVALEGMARGRLVMVTDSCGIAEWPGLSDALFVISSGETSMQALHRLKQLHAGNRRKIALLAREKAVQLHDWNLRSWVHRLKRAQTGEYEQADIH